MAHRTDMWDDMKGAATLLEQARDCLRVGPLRRGMRLRRLSERLDELDKLDLNAVNQRHLCPTVGAERPAEAVIARHRHPPDLQRQDGAVRTTVSIVQPPDGAAIGLAT
jgi:hypothetical protein